MPSIIFESGQLTGPVKEQLIAQLTEVSAKITGIPKEYFLMTIREQPDENISMGGMSVANIKQAQK